ncbi:MAG: AMP-binding protein, partial [Acidobacteriota bacterium]|nr:AMP-binding protein [Acidobacteriota bacterium]
MHEHIIAVAERAERSVVRGFESRVLEQPDAVALEFEGAAWTYARLNRAANGLARLLLDLGVSPGAPVGIALDPGPLTAVAILGVLKAGGAYVPISSSEPAERAGFV